jgi:hypothetical protein
MQLFCLFVVFSALQMVHHLVFLSWVPLKQLIYSWFSFVYNTSYETNMYFSGIYSCWTCVHFTVFLYTTYLATFFAKPELKIGQTAWT